MSRRPPLRKRLGQHHLRHGSLCRPLLEFLGPGPGRVLEVGPGGGVLTRELLAVGRRVVALELDLDWVFTLRARLPSAGLAVAAADALALAWPRVPAAWPVVGNLPYGIATHVVLRLVQPDVVVRRAAFLVQREVAERLVAEPGSAAYGALTVFLRSRGRGRILGRVEAGSFVPPPKVESAFVGLELGAPAVPAEEAAAWAKLVFAAFGQRRKTLRNALGAVWGRAAAGELLERAGVDPRARAQELDVDSFLALYRALREGGECYPKGPGSLAGERPGTAGWRSTPPTSQGEGH